MTQSRDSCLARVSFFTAKAWQAANLGTMVKAQTEMANMPGAALIERGVEDLRRGRESVEALLVSIGAPRLRTLGVSVPTTIRSPEHRLYEQLAQEQGNGAHSAYNALIRRLVSFERAVAGCAN